MVEGGQGRGEGEEAGLGEDVAISRISFLSLCSYIGCEDPWILQPPNTCTVHIHKPVADPVHQRLGQGEAAAERVSNTHYEHLLARPPQRLWWQ